MWPPWTGSASQPHLGPRSSSALPCSLSFSLAPSIILPLVGTVNKNLWICQFLDCGGGPDTYGRTYSPCRAWVDAVTAQSSSSRQLRRSFASPLQLSRGQASSVPYGPALCLPPSPSRGLTPSPSLLPSPCLHPS